VTGEGKDWWQMRDGSVKILQREICMPRPLAWHYQGLCSQIYAAAHTIPHPTHAEKFPLVYLLSHLSDPTFEIALFDKLLSTYIDCFYYFYYSGLK